MKRKATSTEQKFVKKTSLTLMDNVYEALVKHGVHPIAKVSSTAYLFENKGIEGLVAVTHRVMFGSCDQLAQKVIAAGYTVRVKTQDEWSSAVTFDVPVGMK